jgi:uncharacterized protein YodC (DUF2158 family)
LQKSGANDLIGKSAPLKIGKMTDIRIGDLVTLKSDPSVKMTVNKDANDGVSFKCFYTHKGKVCTAKIHRDALVKVTDEVDS